MKVLILWLILPLSLAIGFPSAADTVAELVAQSRTTLDQGHYTRAADLLKHLERQADAAHDGYLLCWAQAMQGYLALQQRQFETAAHDLDTALAGAEAHNWPDLIVRIRLYRGQLRQHHAQWLRADQDFEYAAHIATGRLPDLHASALIYRAALARQKRAYQESAAFLHTTEQLVKRLPENEIRARLELDLAYQYLQLRQADAKSSALESVYSALSTALNHAKKLHLTRQTAQSLGHLSVLYELEGRDAEMAELLQQAVFYAQQSQARDLLLHFEWHLGRYYARYGQQDTAIAAYRRSVGHIQALRSDIPVTYENGRSSFRDTLAPAYLELAELLFDKAKSASEHQRQLLLQEAQLTVEHIKKSELEDYFQNRCQLPSQPLAATTLPEGTAALYPIIFPGHLDLLVLTRDGLRHFSTPVQQTKLMRAINVFSERLRNYDGNYLMQASALYRYLIQPVSALLTARHINTLIYIPDGPLRLVPLSALYDGHHYVLENYAVIISPGLTISRAAQVSPEAGKVLLAGLSEPGEVVNELPENMLQGLLSEDADGIEDEPPNAELRALLADKSVFRKIQTRLMLPSVQSEMVALSEQLPQSTQLTNQAFTLQAFGEQLRNNRYRIVHIASHGFFGGTEQNSFIMTYDRLLTMSGLDTLLNTGKQGLHGQAPELIVLSACQTAKGDDRSPLGISGVAIKAKVNNVLGSLWPVSDAAATLLMEHFYRNMGQGLSKPEALRQAQLRVMQHKEFAGAPFWSPFILVGEAYQ